MSTTNNSKTSNGQIDNSSNPPRMQVGLAVLISPKGLQSGVVFLRFLFFLNKPITLKSYAEIKVLETNGKITDEV